MIRRPRLVAFALLCLSCGADGSTPSTVAVTADGAPASVVQRGVTQDYSTKASLAGVLLEAGDSKATSDVNGAFRLTVPRATPFRSTAVKEGYVKMLQQAQAVTEDRQLEPIPLISKTLAQLLFSLLPGYEAARAVLIIGLAPRGSCKDVSGATVTVSTPGASVRYFSGGLPGDTTATDLPSTPQSPSAVAYNIPPGVDVEVTVKSPTCEMAPFPTLEGGVTYGPVGPLEAGEVTSFVRVFLQ